MKSKLLVLGLLSLLTLLSFGSLNAQVLGSIQCGDIVEGEIVAGQSQVVEGYRGEMTVDDYSLDVQAGTEINLTITPLGATFNVAFVLLDSGGNDVLLVNEGIDGQADQLINFQLGSSNQTLRVLGVRPGFTGTPSEGDCRGFYHTCGSSTGAAGTYFGAYEIRLGCTLRDGTVIEPGDSAEATSGGGSQPVVAPFSGFGFPGLAPVDFASAFRLPLSLGTAMEGEIPPSGDAVLGFRFDGTAGDTLELSFERTSGNLNLGLVVLSEDNQVAYMVALVSSQTMSSTFSLPSTSEYTIGIFRIDLIPPAAPEATAFQITATLNP